MRGRVRQLYISLFDKAQRVQKLSFATSFYDFGCKGNKFSRTIQEENIINGRIYMFLTQDLRLVYRNLRTLDLCYIFSPSQKREPAGVTPYSDWLIFVGLTTIAIVLTSNKLNRKCVET